jgi:hypothetical protein
MEVNGSLLGRAIAQAVRRRLPTAADRVRDQFRSCAICGGWCGSGANFLGVFRFPLPILIPQIVPHSSSIIRGWYNRPISGRRTKWAQSHPTPKSYCCNRTWRPMVLWDVEAPTFSLENRLIDGGKVVSLTRRQLFTPQEDSWYWYPLEVGSTLGP